MNSYRHATNDVVQTSTGAATAQTLMRQIAEQQVTPEHVWLRFWELASAHTVKSAACRAFLVELAKRAAAADAEGHA